MPGRDHSGSQGLVRAVARSGRGIVSRTDLLSVFERPDANIRDELVGHVTGEFGLDAAEFEVTVVSGIVTIAGPINRLETALSLLARIRHAEGVVGVRDRLIVTEPSSQLLGALLAVDAVGTEQ